MCGFSCLTLLFFHLHICIGSRLVDLADIWRDWLIYPQYIFLNAQLSSVRSVAFLKKWTIQLRTDHFTVPVLCWTFTQVICAKFGCSKLNVMSHKHQCLVHAFETWFQDKLNKSVQPQVNPFNMVALCRKSMLYFQNSSCPDQRAPVWPFWVWIVWKMVKRLRGISQKVGGV